MIAIQIANQMIQMNLLKIAKMKKTQNLLVKMKMKKQKMKSIKIQKDLKKEWRMNKKSLLKIK